jgi:ketosteroid isomerase-like protein
VVDPHYQPRKELARANRGFYQCFEKLDLAAMGALWLDEAGEGAKVRCVHPGSEVLVGRERVMAAWAAIFANTKHIRFDLEDLAIELVGEVGWVTNIERIRSRNDEGEVTSEAAATNLFVLRDGMWRMVLHHASPIARRFFRE